VQAATVLDRFRPDAFGTSLVDKRIYNFLVVVEFKVSVAQVSVTCLYVASPRNLLLSVCL
jgi:hypothetical protein